MDDRRIVDLYWERSQTAISETADRYGGYCYTIAYNILRDDGESQECVNDTWLRAWQSMPPERPVRLGAYLGRITRRLALDRWRWQRRDKRGGGQVELALTELQSCLPAVDETLQAAESLLLTQVLDWFLASLSAQARLIFMQRYWYLLSVKEIAKEQGCGESKVKMSLLRSRQALRELLEQEGMDI